MSIIDMLPGVLAIAVTLMMVVGLIWLSGKTKARKEVMFLRPRDKRGEKLDITRETDRSILCEKSDPVHRFIKIGSAFVFRDGGKTVTRFIGIEGSAYTAELNKDEQNVKLSVDEHLKSLWGEKIYSALPQKLKDAAERDKIGITIEPVRINAEEKGLESLSSDEVNDEGDATVLNRLAKYGATTSVKEKLLQNLIWFFLGIGFAAILARMGLF